MNSGFAAAVLTLVLVPLTARTQQTPVFRSGIDVVPITVTVTDQQGMLVTGLTQKDFKVVEDGKPREIVGFYPQTLVAGEAPPPAVNIGRPRENRLEPVTRRTFLIVLGQGRIQEPTKALDGAMTFVRERLLPQDAVALMAFHRVTTFTTDHDAIARVLARYKAEHERLVFDVREHFVLTRVPYLLRQARLDIEIDLGLPPFGGGPPLPVKILDDIDRSLFEGVLPRTALRNTGDLVLGMDLAPSTGDRAYKQQYKLTELFEILKGLGLTLSDAVLQSGPLKLFAGIEHLRFLDGEKHLLFLGAGPPIAPNKDIANLFAARANDARVIVDQVWTGGTATRGASGCEPCRDLVERTGGFYTSVDYAEPALTRLEQRSRSFYLLGYIPVNPNVDGKYRHVSVEVNRPNLTVHHREGYFANDGPSPAALKQQVTKVRTDSAAAHDGDLTDIAIQAAAGLAADGQYVRVDIAVDMTPIGLEVVDGLRQSRLEVAVFCSDEKERRVGDTRTGWTLKSDDTQWGKWLKAGLERTLTVPVIGRPKLVKVIVYDPVSDRTGSTTTTIRN